MADDTRDSAFINGDFNGLFRAHFSATAACYTVFGLVCSAIFDSNGSEHAYAGFDTGSASHTFIANLYFDARHPQYNVSKTLRPIRIHSRKATAWTTVADDHEFLVVFTDSSRKPKS